MTKRLAGGYEVAFLERMLQKGGVGDDYDSFFTDNPGKAIALTFEDLYDTQGGEALFEEPVPELSIVDCEDREQWARLSWELNRQRDDERRRYTILLHREEDLIRLRRAVLLKLVLELNGGGRGNRLLNFIPGRMVEIPEPKSERPYLLDASVARLFFHSVHFYAATIQEIENALFALDGELRQEKWSHLLEGVNLPPLERKP